MYRSNQPNPGLARSAAGVLFLALLVWAVPGAHAAPDGVTDQDIRNGIETEFFYDPGVSFHDIDVFVGDGIATLTGTANHLLEKERAVRIARVVKGVRSVVDRIRVDLGTPRSDDAIREDVRAALRADPAADAYEVDVKVEDGSVTLEGQVDSWAEWALSGDVAKRVRGVCCVTNLLSVASDRDRPDAEIGIDIQQSLRSNVLVDSGLLQVEVSDGNVTLSGIAGSAAEKARAKSLAMVRGVKQVDDSAVTVARWARDEDLRRFSYTVRSDEEVEKSVKTAMLHDPRVMSFKITPDAEDGIVTLRGTVDNIKAQRAAEMDARNTVGVLRVLSRIRVKPAKVGDADLERRVAAALARDPVVPTGAIEVDATDGAVKLTGTVRTLLEKVAVDDAASRVKGVAEIQNDVEIRGPAVAVLFQPLVDEVDLHRLDWYRIPRLPLLLDDDALRADVRNQIIWSPFVNVGDVRIHVDDGVVRLTGEVGSWVERLAAVKNAYEAGAVWVDDDITLRTPGADASKTTNATTPKEDA